MNQSEVLDQIISEIDEMKSDVSKTFYFTEEEILQKKPSPNRWSAIQCFEHMNLTNAYYIKQLNRLVSSAKRSDDNPRYSAGWIASYMIKNIRPKNGLVTYKMRTFQNIRPLAEREENAIVKANPVFADFFADLDEMKLLAQKFKTINPQSIKVKSFAGSLLKLRGIDAIRFLLGHNERHILQAKNALEGK